jgi:integrase
MTHPGAAQLLVGIPHVIDPGLLGAGVSLERGIELVRELVDASWDSPNQAGRLVKVLERFAGFAKLGWGVTGWTDVSAAVVSEFLLAPTSDGGGASVSLMHFRRSALRFLFRSLRHAGFAVGDPTLDLVLPPRSQVGVRGLADDEVLLCRSHSLWSLRDLRRAAAWALAEATCRSVEIAQIRVADVELAGERVWIHGGRTTAPRWGQLSSWGATQLERRIVTLGSDLETLVVYGGNGDAGTGQVSACVAIVDVLRRAGLAAEPDVRPSSVAAWAGRRILAESGRIDEVARRLGMSSLDRTARFISFEWQTEVS